MKRSHVVDGLGVDISGFNQEGNSRDMSILTSEMERGQLVDLSFIVHSMRCHEEEKGLIVSFFGGAMKGWKTLVMSHHSPLWVKPPTIPPDRNKEEK